VNSCERGADSPGHYGKKILDASRAVIQNSIRRMQARIQYENCTECFSQSWNRRVNFGSSPCCVHLVFWRQRLRSEEYSSYLQTMEPEAQKPAVEDDCERTMLQTLEELQKLRATASALHQRMEQLEKSCDTLDIF
jgi:hypothetical protein